MGALSVALLALGGYVTFVELPPLANHGLDAQQSFEALAVGDELTPALSIFSVQSTMERCFAALNSSYGLAQPTGRRNVVVDRCNGLARDAVAHNPTSSLAWDIAAMTAGERGDWPGLNQALARSRAAAPNEEWTAALRFAAAEDYVAQLDPTAASGHTADIGLLLQSNRGADVIAQRYLADSAFRSRITALIETLPADQQAHFVKATQAAQASDTSG